MINKQTYQHNSSCEGNCDEFIDTDCIIYNKSIVYLGLEEGASQTEINEKLVSTIMHLQHQIDVLKNQ